MDSIDDLRRRAAELRELDDEGVRQWAAQFAEDFDRPRRQVEEMKARHIAQGEAKRRRDATTERRAKWQHRLAWIGGLSAVASAIMTAVLLTLTLSRAPEPADSEPAAPRSATTHPAPAGP